MILTVSQMAAEPITTPITSSTISRWLGRILASPYAVTAARDARGAPSS